jgi:hypothetical protein
MESNKKPPAGMGAVNVAVGVFGGAALSSLRDNEALQ